ncbi:hypothetical protein Tco_0200026 [Tanacetum coccineum]
MGRKAQRTLYWVADAVEGGDDGGGGDGVDIVVVVEARGGAWLGGSGRSVDEDHFWFRPEKFSGDGDGRWWAVAGGITTPKGLMLTSSLEYSDGVMRNVDAVSRHDDELMFDTGVLNADEMPVEAKFDEKDEHSTKPDDSTAGEAITTVSVKDSAAPTTIEEITLAQTLIQIKAAKPKVVTTAATTTTTTRPKARGVVVHEQSEFIVPQEAQPSSSKDKGKAKLDAKLIEEKKLARKQEEEANIALIESWENTQDMMKADRLLAEKLQSKEREELTDKEKGKLFMELMEKRRKHFAALKAQEKRNRPPTKAQKRTQMSIYLKHMGGYTYK